MKTQIIQLEAHDDLISIRDKMTWGQTPRILLVWPPRGERLLNRQLDILLLQRQSRAMGARLAFVTRDPEVHFHAAALGIPVFRRAEEAQKKRWRRGKGRKMARSSKAALRPAPRPDLQALHDNAHPRTPAWVTHPTVRIIFFTLGVLAVLTIGAVLFPSAHVTLTPTTQVQNTEFTALTGPSITTVNFSGAIPTRSLTVILEGRNQVDTTGTVEIPGNPAVGNVEFINLTDQALIIPEGTVVTTLDTPPVKFATTRQARLSAGAGETVIVAVQAVLPGSAGNVGAEEIISVEGTLGVQASVRNAAATGGGSEFSLAAPNAHNRQQAYRQLLDSLRASALVQIQDALSPGDVLLTTTPFLLSTLEETYLPAEDEPAETLEVTLRLEFEAQVVREADLMALAKDVLEAGVPDGFAPLPGTLSYTLLTTPVLDDEGAARWQMRAEQTLEAQLAAPQAVGLALWQSPEAASHRLEAMLPLANAPEITLTPSWWPRTPFLPFRIEVGVED